MMWARFGSQESIALNWHSRYSGTRYSGTWLYMFLFPLKNLAHKGLIYFTFSLLAWEGSSWRRQDQSHATGGTATETWAGELKSMGTRSSNELQWLDIKIGHQDSSASNECEGVMIYYLTKLWTDSTAPGRCSCKFKLVVFKLILRIDILSISCEIASRCIPQDLKGD